MRFATIMAAVSCHLWSAACDSRGATLLSGNRGETGVIARGIAPWPSMRLDDVRRGCTGAFSACVGKNCWTTRRQRAVAGLRKYVLESAPSPANMLYATRSPWRLSTEDASPGSGVSSDCRNSATTSL